MLDIKYAQVVCLSILKECSRERRQILSICESLDSALNRTVEVCVPHEPPCDGEEDKGVVDHWDNGGGANIRLKATIQAIVRGANMDPNYALGDRQASCEYGKPHKGKEADDVFVSVEDGAHSEEEKERGSRDCDGI